MQRFSNTMRSRRARATATTCAIAILSTCLLVAGGACSSSSSTNGSNPTPGGGTTPGTTGGMKDYTPHTNPADGTISSAHTNAGDTVTFLGTKDATGFPTAVKAVDVVAATGEHTFITIDANGRPDSIRADNGSQYDLVWTSSTQVEVTATAPGGAAQVKTSVMLPGTTTAPAARPPALSTRAQTLYASGNLSIVKVLRCGKFPVENACPVYVSGTVGDAPFSTPFLCSGGTNGPGTYSFAMPSQPTTINLDQLSQLCSAVHAVLGSLAVGVEALGPAGQTALCTSVGAGVAALATPAAGAAVATACFGAVGAISIYGTVAGDIRPGPTLGEAICSKLTGTIDVGGAVSSGAPYSLGAHARTISWGDDQRSGVVTGDGTWPDFLIDVAAVPPILLIDPPHPTSASGYKVTAALTCLPDNSSVVISVVGSDKYTAKNTATISGDGAISLDVPGAASGVRDAITVTVSGGKVLDGSVVF